MLLMQQSHLAQKRLPPRKNAFHPPLQQQQRGLTENDMLFLLTLQIFRNCLCMFLTKAANLSEAANAQVSGSSAFRSPSIIWSASLGSLKTARRFQPSI